MSGEYGRRMIACGSIQLNPVDFTAPRGFPAWIAFFSKELEQAQPSTVFSSHQRNQSGEGDEQENCKEKAKFSSLWFRNGQYMYQGNNIQKLIAGSYFCHHYLFYRINLIKYQAQVFCYLQLPYMVAQLQVICVGARCQFQMNDIQKSEFLCCSGLHKAYSHCTANFHGKDVSEERVPVYV